MKIAGAISVEIDEIIEHSDVVVERKGLGSLDLGDEDSVLIDFLASDKWKNLDLFFRAFLTPLLPVKTLASINSYLAFVSLIKQSLESLHVRSKRAYDLAKKAGEKNIEARSLGLVAAHDFLSGNPQLADLKMEEAISLASEAREISMLNHFQSFFCILTNRLDKALVYSINSNVAADGLKNRRERETMYALHHMNLSSIYKYSGDIGKSERHFQAAVEHVKLCKTKRIISILEITLYEAELSFGVGSDKFEDVSKHLSSLKNDFIYGFCLAEFSKL